MTEGHAQELKTQAIALQVGKRLRIFLSDNNAGIDDSLIGGVVASKFNGYRLVDQWTSYGWNVFTLPDGHDYDQIVGALRTMEDWDPADRRPMIVIGTTTKGYWPGAVNGKIPGAGDQVVGYPSHPYGMKMNSEYFVALARTFEAALRRRVLRASARDRSPTRASGSSSSRPTSTSSCQCSSAMASGTGWPIAWSRSATRCTDRDPAPHRREARPIPGRSPPGRQSSRGAADAHGEEFDLGQGEAAQDRAVPQGRARWRAPAGPCPRSSSG